MIILARFRDLPDEQMRHIVAYVEAGKPIQQAEAESGVKMIKLGSNENPFGPSPLAIRAMETALRSAQTVAPYDADSTLQPA